MRIDAEAKKRLDNVMGCLEAERNVLNLALVVAKRCCSLSRNAVCVIKLKKAVEEWQRLEALCAKNQ